MGYVPFWQRLDKSQHVSLSNAGKQSSFSNQFIQALSLSSTFFFIFIVIIIVVIIIIIIIIIIEFMH